MIEIALSCARPEECAGHLRDRRDANYRTPDSKAPGQALDQDRVELSAGAHREDGPAPAVSNDRLAELRTRIAEGSYLTPDKIDYVVDRLREELFGSAHSA
ncbi:MAG: flagellar biosynthesis anti-sigma factor FlgM [Phycisphaerae bacterium]|jgi:anti-sigma28 factor (negative regulator of flagellin synthesis)|nr:flagellar biosynthesis anti-sigma factor FlgM [Phycisphaerae bacterium]HRT43501.1 flagellar biosynthesis anti-sigma factor FlgM [Phycisphaerae bacterium]